MKRVVCLIVLLCALVVTGNSQDRISRVGASVTVNADGSISVKTATGKTFNWFPQASLPGSCVDGQLFYKTNDGLYEGIGTICAWKKLADASSFVPTSRTVNTHPLSSDVIITKSDVNLGSADNTSDVNKPVSTAQQTALNLKAPLVSPTFTGTVNGISKSMIGLGNVDNTSDASKPVSTAQQTALDLKANLASPTFTGTVNGISKSMVGLGNVDNTADASKPVSTAQQTALDPKANLASPTFTGTVNGISKSMVGLGNVDNTADASKPVSTAQQTALDLKANLASPTFTGTVNGISKSMVGLGNVDNTADASKPVSTAQQTALDLKANLASPTFTGTVNGISKSMVGLGNVDNTADASKPVSTAQQTALDLKANLASPTFTGTVNGISKSMVGLGNVDNTADASKPVSTAQQTALDLKANLASPTFTGTVIIPTGASITKPNIIGTTTNDTASVGSIGETIQCTTRRNASVSLTTTVVVNICAITLTAGNWDISVVASLIDNITTGVSWDVGINSTSATMPSVNTAFGDSAVENSVATLGSSDISTSIPSVRVFLSTTTAYYLVTSAAFSAGTASSYGRMSARRLY